MDSIVLIGRIGLFLVIWAVLLYVSILLMVLFSKKNNNAKTKLGKAIAVMGGGFMAVWTWLKRVPGQTAILPTESEPLRVDTATASSPDQSPDTPAETKETTADPYPLDMATVGLIMFFFALGCGYADYYLLSLAFEIVFYGTSPQLAEHAILASSLTLLLMTAAAGMFYFDADLVTKSKSKLSKVGDIGLLVFCGISGVLAFFRAFMIGEQGAGVAILIALLAFAISYVLGASSSVAIRTLLRPLGQRLLDGIVKQFPYLGIAAKFVLALPAWTVLALASVPLLVAYLIVHLPDLVVDIRDMIIDAWKRFRNWWAERARRREERWADKENGRRLKRKERQAMKKWRAECKYALKMGLPLPTLPYVTLEENERVYAALRKAAVQPVEKPVEVYTEE